jgi:DNA-binding transcriptional MocR family regulator
MSVPLTDQAIAKIKDLIISGEFKAGSKLPREQDLAALFALSRNSLREAVRALAGDAERASAADLIHLSESEGWLRRMIAGGEGLERSEVGVLHAADTRPAVPVSA